jgi:2-polyprenyl-3-methyl-5-hydroxy-6-metoxy-1,4-benzoquinol methylase
MSDVKIKIDKSSDFYSTFFQEFDFKLADYGYETLQPHFRGKEGLEIGPASGFMTKKLVGDFEDLHVLEASKDLLDSLPTYDHVTKHHTLVEDFDSPKLFDTIVMSHVLEHIEDPVPALAKIRTWLKDDGVFLVAVPNAKSIHRMVAVEMGLLDDIHSLNSRDHEAGHYRVYDMDILIDHLSSAGYKIVKKGGYFLKPLSNGQINDNWNSEMIEGFYKIGKKFPEHCAEIFAVCIAE